ncbi:MAG: SMP-30/gluconolactonase/LRE family protein [Maribacter sp.]|uniref:SMP-30/gluconolactonase/LRE family protein n=1 Tax=Maribacter sp. TaxID=1897614 RepID=UPI00329848D2
MKFSPNIIHKILFGIFCLSTLFSCNSQQLRSVDFTPENGFTNGIEGPAVDFAGNLYAVNFAEQGTIGKVDSNGKGEIYVRLPDASIGNGIRFDQKGDMYIADYVGHNVYQIKKGTKQPIVWAHNPKMSQPNDLAIAPNGTIYLSDPNWAESSGRIWMVNRKREIILLEENMGTTNGIEVSPDGKKLYVNESVQRTIWQYDIQADGGVSNKSKFANFDDFGMDGMRCDAEGNLYVTRYEKGTVVVLSPAGQPLNEIQLKGKKPSNITFGGTDGKTCFVTLADRGCVETFRAKNPGAFYKRIH